MKTETFPKVGSSLQEQMKFPWFGFIYLFLSVFIQFVWGGMKAAKIILMVDELQFSENEAVIIIHLQSSLMDMVMSIGNILADVYCGPYVTCILQELLKVLITCPLCTVATMGFLEIGDRRNLYLIGQGMGVLTAFGNSSLAAFLADQFDIINYMKFNRAHLMLTMACSALGIFTVPHLIQYYQCFWTKTCYAFVWIFEWALCLITVVVFVIMCKCLQKKKPKFSASYMMMSLACDAVKKKRQEKEKKGGRMLDEKPLFEYSNLYTPKLRKDAQKIWSMWNFYLPLAGYWVLHSQQSTTWILQAKRLDGNLFDWSTILPNELWGLVPLFGVLLRMMLLTFMEDTKYPLRMAMISHLLMGFAFFLASVLEKYIMSNGDHQVHMVWALPQLLLVSLSDTTLILSYRKFIIREVPAGLREVTQILFVLSRSFGNAIVVIVNLMEMYTGFPNRLGQFIMYATALNLFLIMFTVLNRKFERLLYDEREFEAGPSTAKR